jgi:hypothetical protein
MMPVHLSDAFTWNVTVAFVLMWLGAALGTVVSVWREGAAFRTGMERRARAFPALGAAAIAVFSIGVLWQLIGYLRLEYTSWWTW